MNMELEAREKKEIERDDMEEETIVQSEGPVGTILPWTQQLTFQGVVASIVIGMAYSVIAMKLNLKTWDCSSSQCLCCSPRVRGFSSYLLGLNKKTFLLSGVNTEGNPLTAVKEPGLGWMTGFLFLIMIVDLKLTYLSGLATAVLINGLHTQGDKMAKKQVHGFMKYFSVSFLWGFFKWFYGARAECGFSQFPTFGLQAWKNTFYFDFGMTFVGAGMICSHLVNLSLLFGSVLSSGVLWPLIGRRKGHWFPESLDENDMKIALILGDRLYNFVKILVCTVMIPHWLHQKWCEARSKKKQNEIFLSENIPTWLAVAGYVVFSIISVIAIPMMFPELKWYYVIVAYLLAPSLAFCNAYGAGLTDLNMSYNYGKVALFVLAAMTGKEHGVVAGLAGCGLIKSVISVACILIQDLKTAHLTFTSPRAMFVSQALGTALGCVTAPLGFFLFYKAFDVGNPHGEFKAPYALIYRNMATLGVQGFSALPQHCLHQHSPKIGKWMPLPMVTGVPFLVGAYFAKDMCLGSLIVFVWHKINSKKAVLMVPAVASGLICGEGLWTLPASVLALAKVKPPMCMKFLGS
ncbi:unnamed protein product [Malus baccata var. baccata]